MNLKLIQLGDNQNEVTINGISILFSYSTPVAYCTKEGKYFKTSKFWSKTTSKHINAWLKDVKAVEVDQVKIDLLNVA